jgi:addiction module RelE/StbE family toxin
VLNLIWRESALDALDEIAGYIAARDQIAADRLQSLFESSAERIAEHPFMHRPGRISGTREAIVHPNYILVYRVTAEAVEILNVLHARQQYP